MSNEEAMKIMSEMSKEILDRGHITHALTDKNGRVLGMGRKLYEKDYSDIDAPFYWSEVYCEPGYMVKVIRKGALLVHPTKEELDRYFLQSIVNLN